MRGGLWFKLAIVAAGLLCLNVPAHAQTCNGTIVLSSGDVSTSPGQSCGGNYLNTHDSDDVWQCLRETLVSGVSHLRHTWWFSSVPAGHLYFIYEGHRPANSDGDNFKFSGYYYDEFGQFFGILMPGAVIDKAFEPTGGLVYDMNTVLPDTTNVYIQISDTATGPNNDKVYLDYLAICSEP